MKKTYELTYVTLVNEGYNNKIFVDGKLEAEFTDTFEHAKHEAFRMDRAEESHRATAHLADCGIEC